jgi:DNA adenine methylase
VFYSPLRYPGGKNKLSKFIAQICTDNNVNGHYVEPYAGGAAVALYLLMNNRVSRISINDFDKSIYAFWYATLNYTEELCALIEATEITPHAWWEQKNIQADKEDELDMLRLGFSTLFLNKTNYSGIINGGMIGGKEQRGDYALDCRFNKASVISKILAISKRKSQIDLTNLDALELINKMPTDKNMIFYFDPPYYLKGPSLYMNHYKSEDHALVSDAIRSIKNAKWIVSYDDTQEIQHLYSGLRKIDYSFNHSARKSRIGNESIFFSSNLSINPTLYPIIKTVY